MAYGEEIVSCKWVFKKKGAISLSEGIRNKARVVAKELTITRFSHQWSNILPL